jgi:hypothetical protein
MSLYERNVMTQAPLPENLISSDPGGQPEGPSAGRGSGTPAGSRDTELPADRPVPVSVVLDRLRDAAAAHDGELPGGIWLEARVMLDPHERQPADLLEPAGDAMVTRGRHRG